MAADLGDLIARILLDNKEFNDALKEVEKQSEETSTKAGGFLSGIGDALGGIAETAMGVAAGFKLQEIIDWAQNLAPAMLEAAAKTDHLAQAFRAIAGPTEETGKLFDDLSNLEFHSLFDFEDTLGPAAKNMLDLGVSTEQTGKTMTALVDAASGMKKGPEWITAVSGAIAEMQTHMVASAKDMKALEREGVSAWSALAAKIGTDVPTAMEKVKAGLVSAQTVAEAVTDDMAKRWKGAGDESLAGWEGAMHVMDEATEEVMVALGKSIGEMIIAIKPLIDIAVKAILDFAKAWEETQGPVQWITEHWPAIKAVWAELSDFLGHVFEYPLKRWENDWNAIKAIFATVFEYIGKAIGVFTQGMSTLFGWISTAVSKIPGVTDEMKKLSSIWDEQNVKIAANKAALDERKKAQDASTAADTKARNEAKAREAQDVANANAAKKLAEERKKADTELLAFSKRWVDSDKAFQASQKKNEDVFTKAYYEMKKAAVETVEIIVPLWDRMGAVSGPVAKRFSESKIALEKLGVTSTSVLTQAVASAQQFADTVRVSFEHGERSASDYGAALAKLKEAQDALKAHTERDLVNAMKTLGTVVGSDLVKAADDMLAAYKQLEATTDVPEDLYPAWQAVLAAQKKVADHASAELTDAYHRMGEQTRAELDAVAAQSKKDYETIARDAGVGTEAELRARIKMLEDSKKEHEAHNEKWTKEDQRRLDQAEKQLEEHTKKQKNVWAEYFKYIEDRAKAFKNDVLDAVWDRLFGPDQNAGLKKQEQELVDSLAERASEWDQYVADNADQMAELATNYEIAMAGLADETQSALDEAAKKYDDYAAEVVGNIEDIKKKHAEAEAEQVQSARDALDDKTQDYEEYARDVAQNIEDIQVKYEKQLEEETEKLRDELADRTQSYKDFVDDANKDLQRLGQDTATNIEDETKDTADNIAERQRDYNRYAEDTATKIAAVRAKNKGVYSQEEADLETSLKRKGEDLQFYITEQNDKLARYTRDQKLRQEREESDLHESLNRKGRDFDEYLKENAKDQDAAVQHYADGIATETGKQLEGLAKKKADYDEFVVETEKKILKIQTSHATAQDAEILKQQEALAQKKLDYDQHVIDITKKSAEQAAALKADYQQGTTDLQTELGNQRIEYDKFVADITGPGGKLETLKSQHTSIWTDIGALATGALNDIGKSLLHLASDEVIGVLTGKTKGLKGVWDDIKSAVDAVGDSAKKIDIPGGGGGGSVPGGGGGSDIPSIPGGGGGGAAEGIMGFLSGGLLGNILSAGQLVSSVILNIQIAKLEGTMNQVERNTAGSMLLLGSRADGGILGVSFRIFEELAYGTLVKAMEKHRDQFYDWTGFVNPIFETIRNNVMDSYPVLVDIRTILGDMRTLATNLQTDVRSNAETLKAINVSIVAQGITTAEAARALGDQIATNLSRQMVPVA